MKITQATIFPLSIPLIEPIKMAKEVIVDAKTVLLCLTDEEGRQGWGEASVAPLMTGETLESLLASVKYLVEKARAIEWGDPKDFSKLFDAILYGNPSAKSCLEMALLDLYTQKNSIALWKYLRSFAVGVASPEVAGIPLLRMLGGSLEKEITDAKSFREAGFKHWKIKIGSLSVEEDLRRVKALSDLLEGDVISVDANGAMSLEGAIQFCTSKQACKLSFAEQLINADSAMADFVLLKQQSPIPIGLDESIHGTDEIEEFVKAKALDGASLKPIKTGGVLAACKSAQTLRANNLKLNLACKVAETSLAGAATAAIGFAIGDVPWGFSMSNQYLRFDICDRPLTATRGHLDIAQLSSIGIGITPNLDRVKDAVAQGYSIIQY
ncbi:enolase C-terminal domain-like protein [Polynucleobacter sp. MG-28-Ekke-A2]|uniref:mandelate racemase/muconate lactonizing enzyme family protein n=1 Tax=Polynucleobacter sp. MG-28-Ekke-A2 TaxID=3108276 RepID=UPI002B23C310|nr:enolase C-terminal domain-like protein [Polynucleobacter sp. MG-28-Ekke-A2]MEA9601737.1 enolase C-terminal domain-like protein [Polynucleobacter sp. MG-28-Ekke-A2]